MAATPTLYALWFLLGLASASYRTPPHRLADKDFLQKQTKIVDLIWHMGQPLFDDNLRKIATSFNLQENAEQFKEPALARQFALMFQRGYFLQRQQPFSIYRDVDRQQAEAIVNLFLTAKDFHTFYSAAVWARENLNEALFSYALAVVVLHREDTRDVVLPAPYELWPQHFVSADVMRKAYDARLRGALADKGKPYVVLANHSASAYRRCPEDRLAYFREDVGLGAYFAMKHYRCPFWARAADSDCGRRGRLFYFGLRQLAARYGLERLSAGLPTVKPVQFPPEYDETYDIKMEYTYGAECPDEEEVVLPNTPHVQKLRLLEERLLNAIDIGFVVDSNATEHSLRNPQAIELLGNIVEGNADSKNENFFGSLYRGLLTAFSHSDGSSSHKKVSTMLENPGSVLKDPIFYRIAKKLLDVFHRFKDHLTPYTRQELEFPGVRVQAVSIRTLSTHLEQFHFELTNAVPVSSGEDSSLQIVAKQRRLTARPFGYNLTVASDRATDAVVRVYLGPLGRSTREKIDERRHHFVLFDAFTMSLSAGLTTLRRTSKDLRFHGRPPLALSSLRRRAEAALESGWRLYVDDLSRPLGGVERLALPRGRRPPGGLPLSLLVVLSPATGGPASFPPDDGRDVAFPLDRRIAADADLDLPNVRFADVVIVHRG